MHSRKNSRGPAARRLPAQPESPVWDGIRRQTARRAAARSAARRRPGSGHPTLPDPGLFTAGTAADVPHLSAVRTDSQAAGTPAEYAPCDPSEPASDISAADPELPSRRETPPQTGSAAPDTEADAPAAAAAAPCVLPADILPSRECSRPADITFPKRLHLPQPASRDLTAKRVRSPYPFPSARRAAREEAARLRPEDATSAGSTPQTAPAWHRGPEQRQTAGSYATAGQSGSPQPPAVPPDSSPFRCVRRRRPRGHLPNAQTLSGPLIRKAARLPTDIASRRGISGSPERDAAGTLLRGRLHLPLDLIDRAGGEDLTGSPETDAQAALHSGARRFARGVKRQTASIRRAGKSRRCRSSGSLDEARAQNLLEIGGEKQPATDSPGSSTPDGSESQMTSSSTVSERDVPGFAADTARSASEVRTAPDTASSEGTKGAADVSSSSRRQKRPLPPASADTGSAASGASLPEPDSPAMQLPVHDSEPAPLPDPGETKAADMTSIFPAKQNYGTADPAAAGTVRSASCGRHKRERPHTGRFSGAHEARLQASAAAKETGYTPGNQDSRKRKKPPAAGSDRRDTLRLLAGRKMVRALLEQRAEAAVAEMHRQGQSLAGLLPGIPPEKYDGSQLTWFIRLLAAALAVMLLCFLLMVCGTVGGYFAEAAGLAGIVRVPDGREMLPKLREALDEKIRTVQGNAEPGLPVRVRWNHSDLGDTDEGESAGNVLDALAVFGMRTELKHTICWDTYSEIEDLYLEMNEVAAEVSETYAEDGTLVRRELVVSVTELHAEDTAVRTRYGFSLEQSRQMARWIRPPAAAARELYSVLGLDTSVFDAPDYSGILSVLPYGDAGAVLREAQQYVGWTYSQPLRMSDGYADCSSLVWRVYRKFGVDFGSAAWPPTAADMAAWCEAQQLTVPVISAADLAPGDVLFWGGHDNGRYRGIYHTGIYAGEGMVIEASSGRGLVVYRGLWGLPSMPFAARLLASPAFVWNGSAAILTATGQALNPAAYAPHAVPEDFRQSGLVADYTPYLRRWSSGTAQAELYAYWQKSGSQDGPLAMIYGCYLAAVSPRIGRAGDIVVLELDDGTQLPCIIADEKGDDRQHEWGHRFGSGISLVEWEGCYPPRSKGDPRIAQDQAEIRSVLAARGLLGREVRSFRNLGSFFR